MKKVTNIFWVLYAVIVLIGSVPLGYSEGPLTVFVRVSPEEEQQSMAAIQEAANNGLAIDPSFEHFSLWRLIVNIIIWFLILVGLPWGIYKMVSKIKRDRANKNKN